MTLDDLLAESAPATGGSHTKLARGWHLTAGAVVCDYGHKDAQGNAWQMLAYGLEYVERHRKHKLILVLPRLAAEHSATRAALLRPGLVEVWRHAKGGQLARVELPSFADAVQACGATRKAVTFRPDPLDTSHLPDWLLELGDWVESRNVERQRTDAYWSWHYRGREVLKVTPSPAATPKRFKIRAGVAFTGKNLEVHGPGTHVDVVVPLEGPLTEQDRAAVTAAVDSAIERRRTKRDNANSEHMLQATIGVDPSLVGMRHVRRELPAGRLGWTSSAFIDFLGVDDDGGLHVIETKLGHGDAQLGVQGLDYWAWVVAHIDEVVARLRADGHDVLDHSHWPTLRYVVGRKSENQSIHRAARATIAALHSEINWRLQLLDNWDALGTDHRPLSLPEDVGPTRDRQLPTDLG